MTDQNKDNKPVPKPSPDLPDGTFGNPGKEKGKILNK